MPNHKLIALLAAGVFAGAISASEGEHNKDHEADHGSEHVEEGSRAEHFEGKPAGNLEQALTNFRQANEKLDAILAKDELTSADMNKVHRLTYTMENAVARLQKEMKAMSNDLEWVHKASERLDEQTLRAKGGDYLDTADKLAD